jgi:hypothetical protein
MNMQTNLKSFALGVSLALGLLGVYALAMSIPNGFTAGDVISAAKMNANFTAVKSAVDSLEAGIPGIDFAPIVKTAINVRGAPVTVATVIVTAPGPGFVRVQFDGQAVPTAGDRLVLAASNTANWSPNDGAVSLLASGSFSHSRVYPVTAAGDVTYYAVAENYVDQAGDGKASIYGQLTATFYPKRY